VRPVVRAEREQRGCSVGPVRKKNAAAGGGVTIANWCRRGTGDMARERLTNGTTEIPLDEGMHYIGRGPECLVVLDDFMVSRRHARLVVGGGIVTLEDCGSTNGTQINRARLRGAVVLASGDQIGIGTSRLVFRRSDRSDTITRPDLPLSVPPAAFDAEPETFRWDLLASFCAGADEAIEQGDATAAETIMRVPLQQLLDDAWRGRVTDPGVKDRAARQAVRLASALGAVKWIDYVVDLHRAAGGPIHPALVDDVVAVAERLGLDRRHSTSYVEQLRSPAADGGA
jgi:hypothetical protein